MFILGVALINGQVYAVGGFNGSLRVRTVDMYDPVKDSWTACPSMEARRSTLGVAVLNDLIYAVGGFDGSSGELILMVFFPACFTSLSMIQMSLVMRKPAF